MANNRMYLVNPRTGVRIYLAKYYPSTGWYTSVDSDLVERLNKGFDDSDFGHLTEEQRKFKDKVGFGPPYANYPDGKLWFGDDWRIEYEIDSPIGNPPIVSSET